MRKILFTHLLLGAFFLFNPATVTAQSLVLWLKSGERIKYALEEKPITTFEASNLVITSNNVSVTHPLHDVVKYTYELTTSDISIPQKQVVSMTQKGYDFTFEGLDASCMVYLLDASGVLLESSHVSDGISITMSLSSYPHGVYFIKTNNAIYKILKK